MMLSSPPAPDASPQYLMMLQQRKHKTSQVKESPGLGLESMTIAHETAR